MRRLVIHAPLDLRVEEDAEATVLGPQDVLVRIGAGGIMLPNHNPFVIAEQFGTLDGLFPGRIDLGLGRAPGAAGIIGQALRKNLHQASEYFPQDVV